MSSIRNFRVVDSTIFPVVLEPSMRASFLLVLNPNLLELSDLGFNVVQGINPLPSSHIVRNHVEFSSHDEGWYFPPWNFKIIDWIDHLDDMLNFISSAFNLEGIHELTIVPLELGSVYFLRVYSQNFIVPTSLKLFLGCSPVESENMLLGGWILGFDSGVIESPSVLDEIISVLETGIDCIDIDRLG